MAITNGTYEFNYGTLAEYQALKDAGQLNGNHFYFTTDTQQIHVGTDLYTGQFSAVAEFPATGVQGVLYLNTATYETRIWTGSEYQTLSPAVSSTLTTSTTEGSLATAGAIRNYVASQFSGAGDVKDVSYDEANFAFTVSYEGTKDSKVISLKKMFSDADYSDTTGDYTFTIINKAEGEDDKVINTVVEDFLSAASYDKATHILTFTLKNGNKVTVDLSDLVDTYTVKDTTSVDMTVENNDFKGDVKVSATVPTGATETDNRVVVKYDGVYVSPTDLSGLYTKAQFQAKKSWKRMSAPEAATFVNVPDNMTYSVDGDTLTITGYTGTETSVSIPTIEQ